MRALILMLAVAVAACAGGAPTPTTQSEDASRRAALVTAVREATPGGTLDLRAVLGGDWDHVAFLGPYTDNAFARQLLGFDFDLQAVSPWTNSEGGAVIVLASGSEAVAWMAVPASTVGLHCLEDTRLPAGSAVVSVYEEAGGFRELADATRPGCGTGSAASGGDPPTPAPSTAADASGFEAQARAAIEAARQIPRDGAVPPPETPTCQAINESVPLPMCMAAFPDAAPILSIWIIPAGSAAAARMMMAYAAMPDGIEGAAQPAPDLGDEARLSRSWSDRGCTAVLAVRDGTLILSVQARLAAGAASSDCGVDVPADYLESVAESLLDDLGAFRAVGLPVDDLIARERAVKLITDGTLKPGDRDLITLPAEFASLSDTGEVVAMHDADGWTIVFFEDRGVVDNYAGWVYRSSGKLSADEDPLGGSIVNMERIDGHWFHVVAT